MRLVNTVDIKSKDRIYSLIEQPMTVYHSTEELVANEKDYIVISSFDELLAFIRQKNIDLNYLGLPNDARYKNLTEYNVWLKTVDTFVPDYADLSGVIFYMMDEKTGFINTDACYVRCYYLIPFPTKLVLFTSAGVNSITITKWKITAAVRTQFLYEYDPRKATGHEQYYQNKLNQLLNRKKPSVDLYKFLFAFLSPDAPSYLDLDKSSAVAYKTRIKKADRYKILQSPAFEAAMIQVLKIIMPEIKTAIKDKFSPQDVVDILVQAKEAAVESKNVDKMLAVYDKITADGYGTTQHTNDKTLPDLPMVGGNKPIGGVLPPKEKVDKEFETEFYDKMREETDSISSFVSLSEEEDETEKEI